MRLLTWNVNGLRAALRRGDMSLAAFLASLNADICCFQETKLTRNELLMDRDLGLAEGWESFFSCTRGKTGYSGVATFCKAAVTVPLAAQEGFTGSLQLPGCKALPASTFIEDISERYAPDELQELDAEGRCVITDHGKFVLFNVYAPALSSAERMEERFAYKLRLFEVLFMRMEAFRAEGRPVVLVGDLNIAPGPIDSCDPGTGAEFDAWLNRSDRAFLRSNLQQHGGAYTDIFRTYHPDRQEAYTCWNQASSARVNNWGTRIDLILLADAASPVVGQNAFESLWLAADIEPERQGSDHAPAWADLDPSQPLALAASPPALSSRFLFTGKQQTLASWLSTCSAAPACSSQPASALYEQCSAPVQAHDQALGSQVKSDLLTAESQAPHSQPSQSTHRPADVFRELPSQPQARSCSTTGKRSRGSMPRDAGKRAKPGQSSMRQFFAGAVAAAQAQTSGAGSGASASQSRSRSGSPALLAQTEAASEIALQQANKEPLDAISGQVDRVTAAAAWRQIHQKMKAPKCPGHKEDCVIREVKKAGPNKGRLFYVCARPDGPKPQGRCDHFQWVGDRKVRGNAS